MAEAKEIADEVQRPRTLSHTEYLATLRRPTAAQIRHIDEIQQAREREIDSKYRTETAHAAATTIQRAYRGHRERRQLAGLTLDPSQRWQEVIREWRWRGATAPHATRPGAPLDGRERSVSDLAKLHWRRAAYIAEHASAGDKASPEEAEEEPHEVAVPTRTRKRPGSGTTESMMMDPRYFLEMIDQKHRYGANLAVFHEEWVRCKSDQNFFEWLDHGPGLHLDLPGCSREKLDRERIRYLTKEERRDYLVQVDDKGLLRWAKNNELISTSSEHYQDSMHGIVPIGSPSETFADARVQQRLAEEAGFANEIAAAGSNYFDALVNRTDSLAISIPSDISDESSSEPIHYVPPPASPATAAHLANNPQDLPHDQHTHRRRLVSPATILNQLLRASVRPGTWIYVADTAGRLYVGIKASGAFQHASFLAGGRISSAGIIGITEGRLTYLSPLSGHYRPTTRSFRRFIASLREAGVDMSALRTSKAYAVLLGMEYYGRTKSGFRNLFHLRHQSSSHESSKRNGQQPHAQDHRFESDVAVGPGALHKESTHHNHVRVF